MRIVVGGHCQIEGINYTETFAVAAKLPSEQVIMANSAIYDWEIYHIDVKSVYINAPLKDLVYMEIPRGARKESNVDKVCWPLKRLYKVLIEQLKFERSKLDH